MYLIGNKEILRQQLQNGTHEDLQQNSTYYKCCKLGGRSHPGAEALRLKLIYNGYKIFNSFGDTCGNYNVFKY